MQLTKEILLAETAALDQQEAQARDTVAKTDQVRARAVGRLQEIAGARAMVAHLLKKLDEAAVETKEQTP